MRKPSPPSPEAPSANNNDLDSVDESGRQIVGATSRDVRGAVSEIMIYPFKGLKGISVDSAIITPTGFQHDRIFALGTDRGIVLNQQDLPNLSLVKPFIDEDLLVLEHEGSTLELPLSEIAGETSLLDVQGRDTPAIDHGDQAAAWFESKFGSQKRSSFANSRFRVFGLLQDENPNPPAVGLNDTFNGLLLSQASVDYLNKYLQSPVSHHRFRANLVFSDLLPFEEDALQEFWVGQAKLHSEGLCPRCNVISVDQETAAIRKDILKVLASFRQNPAIGSGIFFGVGFSSSTKDPQVINVGDELAVAA